MNHQNNKGDNIMAEAILLYNKDTKKFHSYQVISQDGFTGTVYIPRGMEIPETITFTLKTAATLTKE